MTVTQMVEKSLIQSAFTSAITCYWLGNETVLFLPQVFSNSVPCWVFGAVTGGISSIVNDTLHAFVKYEVPLEEKVGDVASLGLGMLSSGLVFQGILYALDPKLVSQYGLLAGLATGAISEVGASFTYNLLKTNSYI